VDSYTFNRVPEVEIEQAKQARMKADAEGALIRLWRSRPLDYFMTAADAGEKLGITRQAAAPRLRKLVARGWMAETINGNGKATTWTLEPSGVSVVKTALGLV